MNIKNMQTENVLVINMNYLQVIKKLKDKRNWDKFYTTKSLEDTNLCVSRDSLQAFNTIIYFDNISLYSIDLLELKHGWVLTLNNYLDEWYRVKI